MQRYTTADGLPGNYVWHLSQGRSGALWLIAGGVLARFDGRRFEEVPLPEVASDTVGNEYPIGLQAANDTLWVSTSSRRVLARVGGVWTRSYTTPVPFGELTTRRGSALFATHGSDGGMSVWRDSIELQRFPPQPATGRPDDHPQPQLVIDAFGVPWVADRQRGEGVSVSPRDGTPRPRASAVAIPLATGAFVRAPDSLTPLGVRRSTGALQVVDRDGRVLRAIPATDERIPRLLARDGRLFVASRTALEIYPPNGGAPERIRGNFLSGADAIATMLEDREGAVWIGTGARGLLVLRPRLIRQVAPFSESRVVSSGTIAQVRNVTPMRDGSALLVADGLLRAALEPRSPSAARSALPLAALPLSGLPNARTWTAALEASDGSLWVSVIGADARQIFAVRGTGAASSWRVRDRMLPLQFVEDRARGEMLVLQRDTLSVYAMDAPERAPHDVIPLRNLDARFLLLTADGTRYIGGQRGVLQLSPSGGTGATGQRATPIREYSRETGYALRGVRALHLDRDGALWIGMYGGGLARLHGDSLRVLQRVNGLAENIVSTILEDDAGTYWMGGNRGVHALTRAEREAWVQGTRTRVAGVLYDDRAGLDNPEGSGWFGARTASGALWFPTFGGAIVIPGAGSASLLPQYGAVTVEQITTGDSVLAVRDTVSLPLGARDVDVRVSAISLQAPETNPLEYRVSGRDSAWRSVSDDRTLRLTGLRPGTWRVEVRGAVEDSTLSAADLNDTDDVTTASVVVHVPPYFRETPAFIALMTVAFAALLSGGVQLRTRTLNARARTLRQEVEEQTHWLLVEQDRTAAALERAVETEGRLRELLMSKARSFASLSHELRTPMTLILEPVRELADEVRTKLSGAGQQRYDTLRNAVQRLERLTTQFLDLADSQSGTLRMQRRIVNVSAFLKDAVSHTLPLAFRKSVHVSVSVPQDMPVSARIDPDHMDKVITNLLTNAIRHAPEGGEVQVMLRRDDSDDLALVLEVRDNGPGVHPDVIDHVFDPFYQGPNATEGMGLGLALSRDIVVQHGGRIEVMSEPGAGALFRVTLPRVTTDMEVEPADTSAATAPAEVSVSESERARTEEMLSVPSCRLLLVEDDYDLREFLRERLGEYHEVRVAGSGEEALRVLREWAPELVVSDIIMPGIDGLALCRILKVDPATRNIPVLLLTAKGSAEDQERGLLVGADAYLVKPVDVRQLLLRIENLLVLKRNIEQRFRDALPAWASVLMRGGGKTLDKDAEQFVVRVYRLLVERMGDQTLDIDAMARALNVSRSLLYRRIRDLLDCSPHDLIMEVRLEQAALLLRTTDQTVASVGLQVGFRSAPHFTRRFVAHFGMSPGEYRRRTAAG